MSILYVLLLILPISVYSYSTLSVDSMVIIQVQDATVPNENSNSYIVFSNVSRQAFFVDTGATPSTVSQVLSIYQQLVQSTTKPPLFVFLTHGHPDHMGGIVEIHKTYPTTPIYVITQQVIQEALKWVDFACSLNVLTGEQCTTDYSQVLTPLSTPNTQLKLDHPNVKVNAISAIVKGEASYEGLLGLTTSSGQYFLFTGDTITVRTHLYISNLFQNTQLPDSDDSLCAWAGSMQTTACDLYLSGHTTTILPGHGPAAGMSSYVSDIAQNLAWLRAIRKLTFNSCNATYVWQQITAQYPDWGGFSMLAKGGLSMRVPNDANSVNCNCSNGLPNVCSVYHDPPTCMHLDMVDSDTTLSCNMRTLKTSMADRVSSIRSFIFIAFVTFIVFIRLH